MCWPKAGWRLKAIRARLPTWMKCGEPTWDFEGGSTLIHDFAIRDTLHCTAILRTEISPADCPGLSLVALPVHRHFIPEFSHKSGNAGRCCPPGALLLSTNYRKICNLPVTHQGDDSRSEEHTSELQSLRHLV